MTHNEKEIKMRILFKRYSALAFVIFFIFVVFYNSRIRSEDDSGIRYVYVIGGAHEGERIEEFKQTDRYGRHDWEIYAIEANPRKMIIIPPADDVTVINKAIWTEDGSVDFYISENSEMFSSVYAENYGEEVTKISIESMDFGGWIEDNFGMDDYVMVSFDIEGSEFAVIKHMIADRTIRYIDELYTEFHPGINGVTEADIEELLNEINDAGVTVAERREM
jgi:FkbM family methyltransferase